MGLLEKIVIGLSNEIGDELTTPIKDLGTKSDSSIAEKKSYAPPAELSNSGKTLSPSASKKSSQVIQVPQLPLSLKLSEYKNPYSNANPLGDPFASIRFQQIVDSPSGLNDNFPTSTSSIEKTYGLIVNGARCSIGNDFISQMISKAKLNFEASLQSDYVGYGEWRLVEAIPNDWYLEDNSRYKKVKISLDEKSASSGDLNFLTSESRPTSLTIGDNRTELNKGTYFTSCELEFMLVRFTRPWMDFTLFKSNGWWLNGQQPGYCSSGRTDENSGILPLINTGMILVRSTRFEGTWDPLDQKRIEEGRTANKEIYIGPYRLLNNSDTVSSVNVVAWVNELVPLSPQNIIPVPGSVKVNNKGAFFARFSVACKIYGGQEVVKDSGSFPVLSNKEIEIPKFSTDVTIKIDIMTWPFPEIWSNVETIKLTNPEVLEYELSGTTIEPKLRKIVQGG